MPRTVQSIAAGSALYLANCAQCHGVEARGGGPPAGTTQLPAADLLSGHLNTHSDADIHYFVIQGLGGGMPAWIGTLSDTQIWELVDFLRALNEGQASLAGATLPPGAVWYPAGSPPPLDRSSSPGP